MKRRSEMQREMHDLAYSVQVSECLTSERHYMIRDEATRGMHISFSLSSFDVKPRSEMCLPEVMARSLIFLN